MDPDRPDLCPGCGQVTPAHDPGCAERRVDDDVVPWAIPIREPDPTIPRREATWVDQVPVPGLVAGFAALVVLIGLGMWMLGGATEPSPEVAGSQVDGEVSAGEGDADAGSDDESGTEELSVDASAPEGDDRPESAPTSPSSTTSAPTTSTAASPTTVDPEPGDLPIAGPDTLPAGWVAQVSSIPASAGGSALSTAFDTVSSELPRVIVLRGSEWPSLRAGFWVIVEAGFDSAAEAVDRCTATGRVGRDACFARYLDPVDDTERICFRDEQGALSGDCG